jgi:hypothetical protein
MLRPRQHYRILQAAFVFALIGVAFFGAYAGYRASEYPAYTQANQNAHGIDYPSAIWHWLTHDAAGFFAAILCIITSVLAWVTYGLFVATAALARDSKEASDKALAASTEATNLARDEFNATHRPELVVREVTWEMVDMDGGEVVNDDAITFALVNKGRNSCTIVESAFGLRIKPPDGRALPTGGANLLGRVELAAGEFGNFRYEMDSESESIVAGARTLEDCYFRGTIVYEDHARTRRRYVFARICRRGTDSFMATAAQEDEYND